MSKVLVLVIGLISFLQAQTIMWEKMIPFETAEDGPVGIDIAPNGDIMVACYTNGPNESIWIADSLASSPDTKVITLDQDGNFIKSDNYGVLFNHSVEGIACADSGFTLIGNTAGSYFAPGGSWVYPENAWLVKYTENDCDTLKFVSFETGSKYCKSAKSDNFYQPVAKIAQSLNIPGSPFEDVLIDMDKKTILSPFSLVFPDSIFTSSYHTFQGAIINDFSYFENGDVIITGGLGIGPVLVGFESTYIIKLDSTNQIIWERYSNPTDATYDKFYTVAATSDGQCIANVGYDIIKYDSAGNVVCKNGHFANKFDFIYRIGNTEYVAKVIGKNEIIKFSDIGTDIQIDWIYSFDGMLKVRPIDNGFIAAGIRDNNIWIAKVDATTGIENISIPSSNELRQNYPNPFNPVTEISFSLKSEGIVTLSVFNTKGELVSSLVNEKKTAGNHSVNFNSDGLNSGLYFYRLSVDGIAVQSRKMMLLK